MEIGVEDRRRKALSPTAPSRVEGLRLILARAAELHDQR